MNIIQFSEADVLPDIRYDFVFKAVFIRDSEASKMALSDLISALIGRIVKVGTITANEPPITGIKERRIRFDISCKTETGEMVNIEMSFNPYSLVPERYEYYEAKLFVGQDIQGIEKNYSDLREAYQIAILSDGLYFQDADLVHSFKYYDPEHSMSLGGKSRIIIVELSKAEHAVEKPVEEMSAREAWAVYFRYLTVPEKRAKINEIVKAKEGIAMAGEELIKISRNERKRAWLLSREKYILDAQSERVTALREGRAEGVAQVARNMKSMGFSDEQIQQATGLSFKSEKE